MCIPSIHKLYQNIIIFNQIVICHKIETDKLEYLSTKATDIANGRCKLGRNIGGMRIRFTAERRHGKVTEM